MREARSVSDNSLRSWPLDVVGSALLISGTLAQTYLASFHHEHSGHACEPLGDVLRAWWWGGCCRPGACAGHPSRGSRFRGAGNGDGDPRDGYQGGGPSGAVPARRQDRAVRRRGSGEDGADHGADQQHCEGARRVLGVCGGGGADPRGERSVQGDDREWRDRAGRQAGETWVQGVMNEGGGVVSSWGWCGKNVRSVCR